MKMNADRALTGRPWSSKKNWQNISTDRPLFPSSRIKNDDAFYKQLPTELKPHGFKFLSFVKFV
jgi:hypothetical protein